MSIQTVAAAGAAALQLKSIRYTARSEVAMITRMFTPLVAAAMLACAHEPLAPSSGAGVSLSLSVSREVIQAGQLDTITIVLRNTTNRAVTLSFGSGCQLLPYIADARGTVVLPSGGAWMCTAIVTTLTLAPGETRSSILVWTGTTEFASEMPLRSLPPGRYSIWARLPAGQVQLQTPPVSVWLR